MIDGASFVSDAILVNPLVGNGGVPAVAAVPGAAGNQDLARNVSLVHLHSAKWNILFPPSLFFLLNDEVLQPLTRIRAVPTSQIITH